MSACLRGYFISAQKALLSSAGDVLEQLAGPLDEVGHGGHAGELVDRGFDYAFDYRDNIHDKPTEYTLIVKNENIDPALRAPVYHTEPVTYPELTTTVTTLPVEDITDKTSDLKGDANCS